VTAYVAKAENPKSREIRNIVPSGNILDNRKLKKIMIQQTIMTFSFIGLSFIAYRILAMCHVFGNPLLCFCRGKLGCTHEYWYIIINIFREMSMESSFWNLFVFSKQKSSVNFFLEITLLLLLL
jgi:hypothetical protein